MVLILEIPDAGLGSDDSGINIWGSVAIPKQRTVEEQDFSKPAGASAAASKPASALPTGSVQAAAARQRASAAASGAAARPAPAQPAAAGSEPAGGAVASGGILPAPAGGSGSKRRGRSLGGGSASPPTPGQSWHCPTLAVRRGSSAVQTPTPASTHTPASCPPQRLLFADR